MNKQEQNLIQTVLAGIDNAEVPVCDDVQAVVDLAKYHMVQNIVAEVLPKMGDLSRETLDSVLQEQTLLLIKDANQEAEINGLIKLFEEQKNEEGGPADRNWLFDPDST